MSTVWWSLDFCRTQLDQIKDDLSQLGVNIDKDCYLDTRGIINMRLTPLIATNMKEKWPKMKCLYNQLVLPAIMPDWHRELPNLISQICNEIHCTEELAQVALDATNGNVKAAIMKLNELYSLTLDLC